MDLRPRAAEPRPRSELPADRRDPLSWLPWLRDAFGPDGGRFRHSVVVFQRALVVACELDRSPAERQAFTLASLLHDVGRALDPDNHGVHAFVGARFLDEVGLPDVAPLVAHHSGAQFEAEARRVRPEPRWDDHDRELLAVLTYLDRTTSPAGRIVAESARRADLARRKGAGSLHVAVFDLVVPEARRGEALVVSRADRRSGRTPAARPGPPRT